MKLPKPKEERLLAPGAYDMSIAEYISHRALAKSGLSDFSKAPAKYVYNFLNPGDATATMLLGSAVHTLVMEQHKFSDEYAVWMNGRKYGKKFDEWLEGHSGKIILSKDQLNQAEAMAKEIRSHPLYETYFPVDGVAERSFFWEHETHKIPCKCRPDFLPGDLRVVDIKSSGMDVDPATFAKTVYNLKYHWSAHWTLEGLHAVTGLRHVQYVFCCVEQAPPHLVAFYELPDEALDLARTEIEDELLHFQECYESGVYPGYPTEVMELTLPSWAYKRLDQQGGGIYEW